MVSSNAGSAWLEFGVGLISTLGDDSDDNGAARVESLRTRFRESREETTLFSVIAANAELIEDDAEVLAVLAAAEFDPAIHHRIASIHGDAAKNRITLGTLTQLFAGDSEHRGVRCVAEGSQLRAAGLVTVLPDGPWTDHVVALHASVVWALIGDQSTDPDLPRVSSYVAATNDGGAPLAVVSGPDRQRRWKYAADNTAGSRFFVIVDPRDRVGWAAVVREATLTGSGVIVEVDGDDLSDEGRRWIEHATHVRWAISSRVDLPIEQLPERHWIGVHAPADPVTDAEWTDAFGDEARTHPLAPQQIDRAAQAYRALGNDLDAAVRRIASGRLDTLAVRIRPTREWSNLVVSADRKAMLDSIIDRYTLAERVFTTWGFGAPSQRGTVALFTGPSGTGKTLAAEVIAKRLGLDVFKLDLSAVVSKYIGETEKNLEQVFDAASAGNLVLFFDEADALFGKRSEVKDSRDRYANIEVSYLLQRIEAYEGLVILATNFEKNLDPAFLRRIHVRVQFASPGPTERLEIWRQNIPTGVPQSDLDLEWIAEQFEMSGGLIHNASIHAAFIAAASDAQEVTTEGVVHGIAHEYRKLGRLIKQDDFGAYTKLVTPTTDTDG